MIGKNQFRAWTGSKMISPWININDEGVGYYEYLNNPSFIITAMQYIGLNDKNDKEIYEGDILEEKYNDEVYNYYVVEWSKDEARFMLMPILQEKIYIFGFGDYGKDDIHNYEVIGNIYENPELLEVKIDEN